MYCQKCGKALTGFFCKSCGSEVDYKCDDGLYSLKALSFFMPVGKVSVPLLCEKMDVGQEIGKQLISYLEDRGLIGPESETGFHEILTSYSDLGELVSSRMDAISDSAFDSKIKEIDQQLLAAEYVESIVNAFGSFAIELSIDKWRLSSEKFQFAAVPSPGTHIPKILSLQSDIAFMIGVQGLRLSPDYNMGAIIIDIPLAPSADSSCSDSLDGTMDGHDFEYYVADVLSRNGFSNVVVTKGSGDFGVDITAEKDGEKYAIQCKRYSSPLGLKPIQEVYTGMPYYQCTKGMVITNSSFTAAACELANNTGIILIDGSLLSQMAQS